jgi:hypothetical protein
MAARKWWCSGLLLLAACAAQPERDEVFVSELASMLAGSYDNLAQSRRGGGQAALRLVIAPVQAAQVGRHVFYVQEMAVDDPRRVLAQELLVLRPVADGKSVILSTADLTETSRWRDGHLNRDLFKSMLAQDVRPRLGCDVLVTRSDKGFTGIGGNSCRISAPGTGETLRVEQRLELDADGIALFELQRDAAGVPMQAGGSDPWYRYARRADTPW